MIIFELSTLYIHEKENTSLNLIKKYEILTRDCLENHFVHRGGVQACFIRKDSQSPGCVSDIAEVWFLYICEIL